MNAEILIVEDEGLIALDLKKKLEQAGYTIVGVVDNSDDALINAERLHPSLILMDIRLRGPKDGIETADQIRQRFHIPVIFVTAHADRETLNRARITEPFGYIVKPFHGIDFRVQIEVALWKHKMEQKLRVSEAWLSATFRNVADALIATDDKGNVALMNGPAAELTGWERDEATGRPLADVFPVADETTRVPVPGVFLEFRDAVTEAVPDGEYEVNKKAAPRTFILTPRGVTEPLIVEAGISANRDGCKTFGIIIAFRDITERRKTERQDRQLQKMNALTLMATGLGRELAESQTRMDDAIKYLIERAHGETSRLLWDVYEHSARQQCIVQQLITLGKTDLGPAVEVNLNQVILSLREELKRTLGVHRSLTLKLQPGVPMIHTDPHYLRENLLRLTSDSRQATLKGAHVEISSAIVKTKDRKLGVRLTIHDDREAGAGAKERAFDPYYQSLPGKKNPGFSLALVCQFVALSGGSIEVETTAGEGQAYILTFPSAAGIPVADEKTPDEVRITLSA